jgi:hypothetical protein
MNDKDLKPRLIKLSKKVNPSTKMDKEKIDKIFDFLDIQISYTMLDIESLRRENEFLRKMLEPKDNGSDQGI